IGMKVETISPTDGRMFPKKDQMCGALHMYAAQTGATFSPKRATFAQIGNVS
uniref:Uncharacterized protein n=1 Tax=Acanthochromis polyacanthus TaxID=80966 RepID=A0A3Q1F0C0_9TELE